MQLPATEKCAHDSFLTMCRKADEKGFLQTKRNANTRFLERRRILTALEAVLEHLPSHCTSRVADIACGTGNFGLLMAERGYAVDFIDNESRFFDYVRMKQTPDLADRLHFSQGDINGQEAPIGPYSAIFFGEAIEHMAEPPKTLERLHELLVPSGILCLTTPNGSFVDGQEPSWTEVKDQKERNAKLANNAGNHVCEFTPPELKDLLKTAGFGVLRQELVNSKQISKRHLLRFLPERWLWPLDRAWANKKSHANKTFGRSQILIAQRFH